jgi:hypothetical protein
MTKVALPRAVAEAIENLRAQSFMDADLLDITNFLDDKYMPEDIPSNVRYPIGEYLSKDFESNFPKYASAIINGYIIEKTPEENVREYWDYLIGARYAAASDEELSHYESEIRATEKVLKLLEIKIEGVNA